MNPKIYLSAKLLLISLLAFGFQLLTLNSFAQNIGINATGATPNDKALLDVDASPSNDKGLLVPRLTTIERDAIAEPIPESLLIYNTTTQCFEAWNTTSWVAFGCIGDCPVPSEVTVSANPNPVCVGSDLNLIGGATDATSWSWSGPNGFTSTTQSPTITSITTAGAGIYTLTVSNTCGSASAVSTASVSVSQTPTLADAGSDINPACDATTVTLAGNTPTIGTGTWTVESGTATITTPSSPTSGVTGLAVSGIATLRWTISNPPCTDTYDEVVITTTVCENSPCTYNGSNFTGNISHTTGVVAPETKTVNYGQTQTSLSGTSKCWITQNLGADHQATSATDATEASAGWYWQFNRKQGYMVGTTPVWTITTIDEDSDWLAANDPCTIELGTGWRVPTKTEWVNANVNGVWNSYLDTYNSVLKIHAAGHLLEFYSGLISSCGTHGYYWSSTQTSSTEGWQLYFSGSSSTGEAWTSKATGHSIRCLRD